MYMKKMPKEVVMGRMRQLGYYRSGMGPGVVQPFVLGTQRTRQENPEPSSC
jgi:hypothetical protein